MGVGDCWAGEVTGGSTYRYKHGFAFGNIKAEVDYRYPFHNGVYVILELLIVLRCYNNISSAYKVILLPSESGVEVTPSMYIRNKSGPSTDPWGTPDMTGNDFEVAPLTSTCCSLLVR